jgi:hypothetical protein
MSDETDTSADSGNQYGDYNGLSAAGNVFFPSWTDHRDDNSEEIFTAKITVARDPKGVAVPSIADAPGNGAVEDDAAKARDK